MKKNLLLLCIMLNAFFAQAQTWDGSVSTDWNTPGNWSTNAVPVASGNVVIPGSLTNYPVLAGAITINRIDMQNGSSLDFNGFSLTINTTVSGYSYFTGATLNNSNVATDIVLTINNGVSGYSTYFRGNTINDKIAINLGGTNIFYDGEDGGNTYMQDASFNISGTGAFWISSNSLSTFGGNLTITRTVAGLVDLFTAGGTVAGNFNYTNLIGNGGTRIGSTSISTYINGTININANHTSLPNVFEMFRVINVSPGGSINVTNSYGLDFRNDTLKLNTLSAAGYRGSNYAYVLNNHITGNVSIADSSTYAGGYSTNIRNNVIIGNAHFESNSSNNFLEADLANSGNQYTGNVDFIVTGTAAVRVSNGDTSTVGGNFSFTRTAAGTSQLFASGGNISGNFSFSNNTSGNVLLGSLANRTGIGGTVNVNVNDNATPGTFQMYRLINQTGGGVVDAQNTRGFDLRNDSLILSSLTIAGYRANDYGTLYNNSITGNISISDDATNGSGYGTYIRENVISGNASFTNNGLNNFYESDNAGSGNHYTGNVTVTATGVGSLYWSQADTSVVDGDLSITRTGGGLTDAFNSGGIIGGNFSFTNNTDGNSLFGIISKRTSISGTINISINNTTPGSFELIRLINQTAGGNINVQNSQGFNLENDTLVVNEMSITGYTGSAYGTLYNNKITGNVTIADDATHGSGYGTYLRANEITGNSSFTNNGLNNFYDADNPGSRNKYTGDVAYIRNASSFTVGTGDTSEISGNLTLNSASGITITRLRLNGASNTAVEQLGIQPLVIAQLTLAKTGAANITLNDSLTISTALAFNGGSILSSSTNFLKFSDNAIYINASGTSHVNGVVAKVGNDAFSFPVGDGIFLKPVSMTAPSNVNDRFSAQYFNDDPGQAGYDTSAHAGSLLRVSGFEYWNVQRQNGSSNVTLTFTYTDPGSGQYITVPAQARIAHWAGSTWEDLGNGGSTGTTSGTVTTAAAVSNFSPFTFGSVNLANNPLLDAILFTYYADNDADTFGDAGNSIASPSPTAPAGYAANSTDCDDDDNTVYPGAPELCDGKDNDCDGTIDDGVVLPTFYRDLDGDGFGDAANTQQSCNVPGGYVSNDDDCDDTDNTVYPNAPELCDGKDNDCDGTIDDGIGSAFYRDLDGDGFGDLANSQLACSAPLGYVANNTDCNDNDNTIYPNAPELCDGKDNDCDGTIDDGAGTTPYYADADLDGFGDPNVSVTGCTVPPGYVSNNMDCNDADNTVYPGAPEFCDGKDNNCDGAVDEGVQTVFFADSDGDGFGNINDTTHSCSAPVGYVLNSTDCDDTDNTIYPNAPELCDGKDNDCDGSIDDGAGTTPYYEDADADGFGNPNVSVTGCTVPPGYVSNNTDCNDADNTVYPGAVELCDGKDNDCDGTIDDGVGTTFYRDFDGDGFGDINNSNVACSAPNGYVSNNTDCDDTNNTVYPGAPELCDGKDNNCNGTVDEGLQSVFYADADGDGFGNSNDTTHSCSAPAGYILDNTDCDDNNDAVYPGAPEITDGLDNNCNGQIDEGGLFTFYLDSDNDGFGDINNSVSAAVAPPGYVSNNTDCDDDDNTIYPGAPELCDGKDNDCDGTIDGAVSTPLVIGPTNMCPFVGTAQQVVFNIDPLPGVTGYQWTVPPTVGIVSGQNTNTLTVTILPGFTASPNKQIRVTTTSPCGNSPFGIHYLLAQYPSGPGFITGPAEACSYVGTANEAVYKINKVTAATAYTWTVSPGMTINSHPGGAGVNDTIINVLYGPTFTGGTITVRSENNCGSSINARQLTITNGITATPGLIQGPANACMYMPSVAIPAGTAATYIIRKVMNATSYAWSVPAGASISSHPEGPGSNDTVIVVSYSNSFTGGNITVMANGICASSNVRSLAIQASLKPGTVGAIIANEIQACPDRRVDYSIVLPSNTNWVQWTVPANAVILNGQGTTSITVSYPLANAGFVTATPSNGCGVGKTRSLQVNLTACRTAPGFAKGTTAQPKPQLGTLEIHVFPNPTQSEFNIYVTSVSKERIQARLYDVNGKQYIPGNININELTDFGNNLKAGVYLLEVIQGSQRKITRLVKF